MNFLKYLYSAILLIILNYHTAAAQTSEYHVAVVECAEKVQLLDYYEGETLRSEVYDSEAKLTDVVLNVQDLMADRAEYLLISTQQFEKMQKFSQQDLGIISKSDMILRLPEGCRAAIVLKSDLSSAIEINQILWNKLSPGDRAGVILNWGLARESYQLTNTFPQRSLYLRNVNSFLPTKSLYRMTLTELTKLLKVSGLTTLRRQGVLIDLSRDIEIQENIFLSAYAVANSKWVYTPKLISSSQDQLHPSQTVQLRADMPIFFHQDGSVKGLRYFDKLIIPTLGGSIPVVTPEDFSNSSFDFEQMPYAYFYQGGFFQSGYVIEPVEFKTDQMRVQLAQHQGRFDHMKNSLVSFEVDGKVDTLTHISGSIFFQGSWLRLEPRLSVVLWDNGLFKEFTTVDSFKYVAQTKNVSWSGFMMFELNGQIQCGYLAQKAELLNSQKQNKVFDRGQQICFNRENLAN